MPHHGAGSRWALALAVLLALTGAIGPLGLATATAAPPDGRAVAADEAAVLLAAAVTGTGPARSVPVAAPLPATPDGPVPPDLRPSLSAAPRDYPTPYLDGCHVEQGGQSAKKATCLYGNLASTTEIVLFGDSHALSWFPAVMRVATRNGWRLHVLTMSACSPADIPNYNTNYHRVSTECTAWRKRALAQIAAESPAIVLVAGTRGFATVDRSGNILAGDARTRAWQAGMKRTLDTIAQDAARVIVIGDVPVATLDPPTCLAANPMSVLACASPVASATNPSWLAVEQRAAEVSFAGFIDPTSWVCPSSPCPAVIRHLLVFRDKGHLTATFVTTLAGVLNAAIIADIKETLGVTTFD